MLKLIYRSLLATVLLAVICCGIYPLIVAGIGQLLFSTQSNGSLIFNAEGKVVGSALIGQSFSKPEYFHGRPSAAGDKGYDAANSSGSNLGPTTQKFFDTLKGNVDSVLRDNPTLKVGEVPVDLVTASGSGLDPHISPEGAFVQLKRVARVRGIQAEVLRNLVSRHIEGPQWGIFGESVVNVLALNLDLDRTYPVKH